jgi:antirestriction protein ArdC
MPLRSNGMPYRGMNVLLLWGEAVAKGYTMPTWRTYRQAVELGAQVRKGEQGSLVVYANSVTRTETDEQGKEHECSIPFMKSYTVFNVEQIDGLASSYQVASSDSLSPPARISSAERFAAATAADIRHGGDRAFYSPVHDFVQMPPLRGSDKLSVTTAFSRMNCPTGSDIAANLTAKNDGP